MKPIFNGERVMRTTLEPALAESPERLLTLATVDSLNLWHEAKHYDNFRVSAVAPVFDARGNLKMLGATNYRPGPCGQENPRDTRVCAEQAMLDNSVEAGDVMLGVLFVRGPKDLKPIEGCREMDTLHLCRPCRGRMLSSVGANVVVATFVESSAEPVEAFTIGQMIEYHDLERDYPRLPDDTSARNVVIDAFKNRNFMTEISKPTAPRRRLPASERTQ